MSETLDITDTLAAKSDQLNAVDLVAGPITGKITNVKRADTADQPIWVTLDAWPKPWKPCKTMRRVMARLWGSDAKKWVGQRLTLFCDPSVKWAGEEVGGIRISHASIPEKASVTLATRGKKAVIQIGPLGASVPSKSEVWKRLMSVSGSESVAKEILSDKFGITTFEGISREKLDEIVSYCRTLEGE